MSMVYSPNGKGMVLRKIVLKKYSIKDTMPIKISFMHYMKSTRVMLPVVFEEFEVAYIFSYFFLFIIIVDLHKANFSKNLGRGGGGGFLSGV